MMENTEPIRRREPIPRPVWLILLSWGLAVLVISGLLSAWVYSNQRQQDRDMCAMTSVFLGGPDPVPGPAGDRSRAVRKALLDYRENRDCAPPAEALK
jgi:hypothetical protein